MKEEKLNSLLLSVKRQCPNYYRKFYERYFKEGDKYDLKYKLNCFFGEALYNSFFMESAIYSHSKDKGSCIGKEFTSSDLEELISLNFLLGIFNEINKPGNYNRVDSI